MTRTERLPRWPILLALVAWFPVAPAWRSDDFIAVHYATDLARVLHDFVGNQYGLPGLVWFYRPLITLSFWVDGVIAFRDPQVWCWVSHVSNVLAHAVSAWLLLRILARCVERPVATWGAALWAIAPGHAGSICWAVGRVDSHTTVWILLCVLAFLRWMDGERRSRALALAAQVLALLSKEEALVIPGVVLVLAFVKAPAGGRVRHALRAAWPFVVVEAAYLGWRLLVLGRVLGGYDGALAPPRELAVGLATWAFYGVDPLAWLPSEETWALAGLLGLLPAALGLGVMAWRGHLRVAVTSVVLFACCSVPLVQFWAQTDQLQNLRYFYLPLAPLLVIVAFGRAVAGGPMLLACFAALTVIRSHDTLGLAGEMLPRDVAQALAGRPPGRLFVETRPEPIADPFYVPRYHLGLDRLSQAPFGSGQHRLLALRPLADRPGTASPGGLPPGEAVLRFAGFRLETTQADAPRLFEPALDGPDHWTTSLYWDLHLRRSHAAFVMRGVRAKQFRITIFTAGGWVSAICADQGAEGSPDGRVPYLDWMLTRTAAANDDALVLFDLERPTVLDLDLRFPILIEAVAERRDADGKVTGFAATHTASRFLWIELDRDYSDWLRSKPR